MRLASTKQSLEKDEEFKFKTRGSLYSKQNEKLWTLIDKYKKQKAIDKEMQESKAAAERLEKYKTEISRQMEETQARKGDNKVKVQKDREDIEQKMALYRKDQALEKQLEEEKKIKLFEMMQTNIQQHQQKQQSSMLAEKALEHLTIPKEYIAMDEAIKQREKASREKKHQDDLMNRNIINSKIMNKANQKAQQIE